MSDLSPSAEALGRALVDLGGEAAPGEAAAAAGVRARAQADGLNRLREAGLVTGTKVRVTLTPAGWSRFSAVAEPVKVLAVVDDALALWGDLGLYAHRAFLELLVSAVVARHHIGTGRPDRHLAFIAVGETGTGKSALAGAVCDLFGLDPVLHELYVPAQTPGAVIGRREPGTQRWVPAPVTGRPFVLFDEFDKADEAVRKALMPYLDGRVLVQYEGEPHQLRPTPMLAANPPRQGGRLAHVRDEFRRRAVVLDTHYAAHRGADLERALTGFYARQRPRLDLERLQLPTELAAPAREVLSSLRHALTADGQAARPPLPALEAVTLGRVALLGDVGVDAQALAAFAVGVAYLQVTEQLPGEVVPNWQADMAAFRSTLTDAGPGVVNLADQLEASIDASRRARADAHSRVRQVRVARESEDLELVGERNRLAEELRQAIDGIDGRRLTEAGDKQTAAALRAQLRATRTEVVNARSATRLEDLRQLAAGPLLEASALQRRVARAVDEARQEREQHKAALAADRRAAQQQQLMAKADARRRAVQLRGQLQQVQALARELEQLYRRRGSAGDRPPFAELEARRLLRYTAAATEDRGTGLLERLGSVLAGPHGWWHATRNEAAYWPGSRLRCDALAEWGENTRAVIWPALQEAYDLEERIAQQLGRAPRRRKVLPAPAARLPGQVAMPRTLPRGRS